MSFFTQMSKSYRILSVISKNQIKLVVLLCSEEDTLEVAHTYSVAAPWQGWVHGLHGRMHMDGLKRADE